MQQPIRLPAITLSLSVAFISLVMLIALSALRWIPAYPDHHSPLHTVPVYAVVVGLIFIGLLSKFSINDSSSARERGAFFAVVFLFGLAVRVFLAFSPDHNYDIESYEVVVAAMERGKNVYAATSRYNYSPIWFLTLGILNRLQSLDFAITVRLFTSLIDCLTLPVLVAIAKTRGISPLKVALLFFLNPVSILISGYHGQFENLAILVLLIGVLGHLRADPTRPLGKAWLWIFATLALIVKHNIFYEVIVSVNHTIKQGWLKFVLIGLAAVLFLVTFVPYATTPAARSGIYENVLLYNSIDFVNHGIQIFVTWELRPVLKWLFIAGLILYPFMQKHDDLIRRLLLGTLFFLTFATGYSTQYRVLPIALGALISGRGFVVYTVLNTLTILGASENLNVSGFRYLTTNVAWLGALYWFFSEESGLIAAFYAMLRRLQALISRQLLNTIGVISSVLGGVLALISLMVDFTRPIAGLFVSAPILGTLAGLTLLIIGACMLMISTPRSD